MGNSHAGHWLPALEALATKDHWQLDTYVAAMCLPFTAPLPFSQAINGVSAADLTPMCTSFNQQILAKITTGPYDLVIMSAMDLAVPAYTKDYEATIRALTDAGKKVLVIRDTPAPMDTKNETPDCVATHIADLGACSGSPGSWIRQDPLAQAAQNLAGPQVKLVGVNQYICEPTVCPPVIGGVIVYTDFNHMTATFAASLAPYLEPAIRSLLSAPSGGG